MPGEAEWAAWFRAYESFILHYARLAERHDMEALAVGTELGGTTARSQDWRRLVMRVRREYAGQLTYCANWDEVERVDFWDALDFIGVQAYYPLGDAERPSRRQLEAAWAPIAARLEALSERTGKRVVFTEVGYRSLAGAVRDPWNWDTRGEQDLDAQRHAYEALFATFWERRWFGGTFVWKWHPHLGAAAMERTGRDFSPQGKPALAVVRRWYARPAPAAGGR